MSPRESIQLVANKDSKLRGITADFEKLQSESQRKWQNLKQILREFLEGFFNSL